MALTHTRTPTSLTIVIGFRPRIIPSSHPNFKQLSELVKKPRATEDQALKLIDIPAAINSFTGGNVTVINGKLYYKGFEVRSTLAQLILGFIRAGEDEAAEPFKRFLEKAHANPDPRAAEGLFDWCQAGGLPITPDGDILAWKMVQKDYQSKASGKRGKLRHRIGDVVEEPRHETDGDPSRTCSVGIHFCSLEYIKNGSYGSLTSGDRIVAVSISPADVIAFPHDYKLSKGRCCKLTVVGEVDWQTVEGFYGTSRVYRGWEPVAALTAAPVAPAVRYAAAADLPVQPGDVWVNRDGVQVTCERVQTVPNGKYGDIAWMTSGKRGVWAATGRANGKTENLPGDLITLVSRQKFAVGQVWRDRNGTRHTVTAIEVNATYPLRTDRGVFTKDGEYIGAGRVSAYDLVTKVR